MSLQRPQHLPLLFRPESAVDARMRRKDLHGVPVPMGFFVGLENLQIPHPYSAVDAGLVPWIIVMCNT
jgi:hypothetical protein